MNTQKHTWAKTKLFLCLFVLALIFGCSINHDYVWQEHEIDPDELNLATSANITAKHSIKITAGEADQSVIVVSHTKGTAAEWNSSMQVSDALATQVNRELSKRNYTSPNSKKWGEVRVRNYVLENRFWGDYNYITTIELKLGNGQTKTLRSKVNGTHDWPARVVDRVIAQATIDVLNNKEFLVYLNDE